MSKGAAKNYTSNSFFAQGQFQNSYVVFALQGLLLDGRGVQSFAWCVITGLLTREVKHKSNELDS